MERAIARPTPVPVALVVETRARRPRGNTGLCSIHRGGRWRSWPGHGGLTPSIGRQNNVCSRELLSSDTRIMGGVSDSEQNALNVLSGRLQASISLIQALGGGWKAAELK